MSTIGHRQFKDRLYCQFARLGKALASPQRLELLDLLAQGERTVESLGAEIGSSTANTSQQLQALRRLRNLPKSKPYVAYCRGPCCGYADQAVAQLRKTGRQAHRRAGGFPEWKSAGLPIETGVSPLAD